MLGLIEQMSQMGGFTALTFIVIFLFAIREGYNFVLWVLDIFNVYHKNEQKKAEQDVLIDKLGSVVGDLTVRVEALEERLDKANQCKEKIPELENKISQKDEQIQSVMSDLSDIKKTLKEADDQRKKETVANARNTMYRMQLEARSNGYVTQASLENFLAMADTYLNLGGNSYYKKVIIPSYLDFPIHDVDDEHSMIETSTMLQDVKDRVGI